MTDTLSDKITKWGDIVAALQDFGHLHPNAYQHILELLGAVARHEAAIIELKQEVEELKSANEEHHT